MVEIAEAVHAGRRLLLLRRRQLQRHRRQGAAGRSRRRRHAHQPAQDVLDAAWRRRAGRRAGGAVGGAGAVRAGAVPAPRGRTASRWSSTTEARAAHAVRPHDRLPRPDGHVRARAGLHAVATAPTACGRRPRTRCSTPTTSRVGLADVMSLPFGDRPCMHEVLFDDHWLKDTGVTTLDFAKAMIDEGYPPDDGVFPAGRARRHADRADRDRNRRQRSTSSSPRCATSPRAAKRGDAARFNGAPHLRAAPPPRRDRAPPASRCCAGPSPWRSSGVGSHIAGT